MALLLPEPPEGHSSAKGQGETSDLSVLCKTSDPSVLYKTPDLSVLYKTSLGRSWQGKHTGVLLYDTKER